MQDKGGARCRVLRERMGPKYNIPYEINILTIPHNKPFESCARDVIVCTI